MSILVEGLWHAYPGREPTLAEIDLALLPGRVVGLFGPNGSGKSTLLRCLNGGLAPSRGRVLLGGRDVRGLSPREVARQVAVVPQEIPSDVPLTVRQVVQLGRFAHQEGWAGEEPGDPVLVEACLERLGVAHLAARLFSQVSGGERQRVVIARALAQQGCVMLMDEPVAHLDLSHQWKTWQLTRELALQGQAVLVICHDLLMAPLLVDHAVVLHGGRLVASGPPREALGPAVLRDVFRAPMSIQWEGRHQVRAALVPTASAAWGGMES